LISSPPAGWPQGYALARHAELDSTNEEARRLALGGERGPLWITATRQTAGRGRRGRAWEMLGGNLAATLLLTPSRPQAEWPQLSFAAAIACADMAAAFAPAVTIMVKWPNDVLVAADGAKTNNYRKLAGLLLESAGTALAVGVGVNLADYPTDTEFPAVSLAALGVPSPDPDAALASLAVHFAKWYDLWAAQGFAPLREAWLARAAGVGMRIRARLPQEERFGLFEGIDEGGALLLNEGGRTRAISAGEVFL
jgi:BirA family biotin operon repressor/biotin-[acetyl-CoA-carboxylase] ligase